MNPPAPSQLHFMQHETCNQLPSWKRVENLAVMTDEMATTLFLGDLSVICDEITL